MTRREQWISFYTAALAGTADPRLLPGDHIEPDKAAAWVAKHAERIADEAMARLDALDFPEPKVRALLLTAQNVWKAASHRDGVVTLPAHLMSTLGAAIHDMEADS